MCVNYGTGFLLEGEIMVTGTEKAIDLENEDWRNRAKWRLVGLRER
jgi:hypothetical protein